ncbi:hypothetical protein IscW_ISCW011022 [Ixodes scapularis]|uniref:Mutator-like transposase domain-containing protein n=1 Tax=Ixodes scapularis TaxID=6945 RepID=B7Q8X1_IXOSC|nr:hypothetical protein IscW_ISCW011022 [Ixodes scapularis]|eukprot:XP_002405472.1 hypothetical protein IscW_ISCW011022 [Ixodes scapularis]
MCGAWGDIVTTPQSAAVGETQQSELPARLCVVGKDCSISFTNLKNLFGGMNAPLAMHLKTYQNTAEKVHEASMAAARDKMQEAAAAVKGAQVSEDGEDRVNNADDLLDVCVSYDGTWKKRGHTSNFGVGTVNEVTIGLVLDFSVRSKYCHGNLGPKEDAEGYQAWMESRKDVCQKNFRGLSNAMEFAAAGVIFSRSLELHKLQHVTMLSDGDSKAYTHVAGLGVCDKDILKEDCVNHVAKRIHSSMEKLKSKKGLGRKGKLTNVMMRKLTNYYATALKGDAPDVTKMQKEKILKKMGIYPGSHHEEHPRKATQQKVLKAKVKAMDTFKTAQKCRRLEAIANEQKRIEEEGPTYGAGEF